LARARPESLAFYFGLGEGGWAELPALGRGLVEAAELVVGGERHLAMLPKTIRAERSTWATPLRLTVEEILRRRGRPVAVLATGDPMHYGVGVTLARAVAGDEILILPTVSAFSLAAARLGWSVAECECLTLHGRPLEKLGGFLTRGARLLLLSHDGSTPAKVAAELTRKGWGPSRLVVLEHMAGAHETGRGGHGGGLERPDRGGPQHAGGRMPSRDRHAQPATPAWIARRCLCP
jgi:precorrin-6Y C5,15-methyltransferase (decarboxylating)